MSAPQITSEDLAPGVTLTPEQTRRALALHTALALVVGRGVQITTVRSIARWIYSGEDLQQ